MFRPELIHPMIVHFPIVLVICLFALDAYAAARVRTAGADGADGAVGNAAVILAAAAGVFALVAYMFGDQAYDIAVAAGRAPASVLEMHQDLGSTTAFAIAAWAVVRIFLWWRQVRFGSSLRLALAGVDGLLVAAVLVTAFYGGRLVYDYGVAVSIAGGH